MDKNVNQSSPQFITSRFKIIIAFIAITIAVIYLIVASFSSATTSYMSVEDAVGDSNVNSANLGVIGKLVPNTFRRSTDGLTAYFSIKDEFSEKQTTYLSANTKGAGGNQTTTQPFSSNIFKPRGLGLKPSFMKQFIDEKVYETWLKD